MLTFMLDPATWDLQLDESGQLATVEGPYAVAQSVANAIRLFTKDAYFDQDQGIPHFNVDLGLSPPPEVMQERLIQAARSVVGVQAAAVTQWQNVGRTWSGVLALTIDGAPYDLAF